MSEVLGDAEPPFRDDEHPPFDEFDDADDYSAYDDDFASEPGAFRSFVAGIATPEALSIAAVVVATASLLDLPAVNIVTNSTAISRALSSSVFPERVAAAGQLIVAVVGALLAGAARRSATPRGRARDAEPQPRPAWVTTVSGAAVVIAAISAVFAIVAFVVAGTAHQPSGALNQPSAPSVTVGPDATQTVGPGPTLPLDGGNPAPNPGTDLSALPFPLSTGQGIFIDPSTGQGFFVDPSTGGIVGIGTVPAG